MADASDDQTGPEEGEMLLAEVSSGAARLDDYLRVTGKSIWEMFHPCEMASLGLGFDRDHLIARAVDRFADVGVDGAVQIFIDHRTDWGPAEVADLRQMVVAVRDLNRIRTRIGEASDRLRRISQLPDVLAVDDWKTFEHLAPRDMVLRVTDLIALATALVAARGSGSALLQVARGWSTGEPARDGFRELRARLDLMKAQSIEGMIRAQRDLVALQNGPRTWAKEIELARDLYAPEDLARDGWPAPQGEVEAWNLAVAELAGRAAEHWRTRYLQRMSVVVRHDLDGLLGVPGAEYGAFVKWFRDGDLDLGIGEPLPIGPAPSSRGDFRRRLRRWFVDHRRV